MAAPLTIFKASTGLDTQVDPARLLFDPEVGVSALAATWNIDHDYTGRISRRKGFTATAITASCHSLFCEGGDALMVTGTSLCLIAPDLSGYRAIATVTAGAPVSYAQVGDMIFWVNGFEKGVVQAGVNSPWVRGEYYGPTSRRVLSDPPLGTIVRAHSGFMYVVTGSVLWHSDAYSLNAFDLLRGFFRFPGQITMVRPVKAGIFVGTDQAVWFLDGANPRAFQQFKASRSPAFLGTDLYVDLSDMTPKDFLQNRTGEGVLWTGPEGASIGMPDGQVFHLTKDKLAPLAATDGSALIIDGRYICNLKP
jgi:hypothetical protein